MQKMILNIDDSGEIKVIGVQPIRKREIVHEVEEVEVKPSKLKTFFFNFAIGIGIGAVALGINWIMPMFFR